MEHYISSEIRKDEIWLGNTIFGAWAIKRETKYKSLKTIRIGEVALDINGEKIDTDYCRPVFIHKSEAEAYDKIMMDEIRRINRGEYCNLSSF